MKILQMKMAIITLAIIIIICRKTDNKLCLTYQYAFWPGFLCVQTKVKPEIATKIPAQRAHCAWQKCVRELAVVMWIVKSSNSL